MTTPTPLPLDAAALDRLRGRTFLPGPETTDKLIAQSRSALTLAARVAELESNNEGSLKAATYWKEQHDRAAKRVAELERELEAERQRADNWRWMAGADSADLEGCAWMEHANALDAAARNLLHYINVMPDAETLLTPEVLLAETQLRAALSYSGTLAARIAELDAANNTLRDALEKADAMIRKLLSGAITDTGAGEVGAAIGHALSAHPAASLAAHDAEVLEPFLPLVHYLIEQYELGAFNGQDNTHDRLMREWCEKAIRALAAQAQEAPNA